MISCFFSLNPSLVVEDNEFPKSTSHLLHVSCMCRNSILIHLFVSTSVISLMMFYVKLLSELMILLSTQHMTNHRNHMNCNVIYLKYFYFASATFWFWSVKIVLKVSYPFKLKHYRLLSRISIRRVVSKIWNFYRTSVQFY